MSPFVAYFSSCEYRYLIKNGSAPYPEIISPWVPLDKSKGIGYCMIYKVTQFCPLSSYVYSLTVSNDVYRSAWWSLDAHERRNMLLLAAQINKTVVFNAGLFATLSVATFMTVSKSIYGICFVASFQFLPLGDMSTPGPSQKTPCLCTISCIIIAKE
ncbi:unnamed protein product [Leptidea sinapis]|uniref:Odorant receptor n=1 Tax=Leptidea sinapis TaxID=189913 RepID=A0A5E4QAY5_9NEOP|nr:unnamed protein product [Leptidea sinapis]